VTASRVHAPDRPAPIRHYGASLSGEAFKALRVRFPGRDVPVAWAATAASRPQVLARLDRPPLRAGGLSTLQARRTGTDKLLQWLETFPGETWQQRWRACPAGDRRADWVEGPLAWLAERGDRASSRRGVLQGGLAILLCADVLRPDLEWLISHVRGRRWRELLAAHRDPEGFAALELKMDLSLCEKARHQALAQVAMLLIAKGGGVRDICVGDCLELREVEARVLANGGIGRTQFYTLLRELGIFPGDAPSSLARIGRFTGQSSVEGLVDRYALQCGPVRDLIVDYLSERQPALDYSSLDSLSRTLGLYFWKNLETHHPDPVIRAYVNHHARPAVQPGKEIRCMPPAAAAIVPVQPERLRADRRHRRIEVQQHQVIMLKPGLVTDMPPRRGQPPPSREMLLAP